MNFEPSEEQEALLGATTRFLSDRMPLSRLRRASRDDGDNYWGDLAALGVFGVTATPDDGGLGLGLAEEALMFRELGRHLISPSTLATVMGRRFASLQEQTDVGARLLAGSCRAAFAVKGERGDRFLLIDAQGAELILIVSDSQIALTPREAFTVHRRARPLDEAITIELATLDSTAASKPNGQSLSLELAILASAMMVGIAEEALRAAVEHAKQRIQFGVPIGSFQAIKHLCADNAVRADAAWSQTLWAALALQEHTKDAPMHAAAATLLADDAARQAAQDNVQIHGGMGFTAECDAHRFVKRRHVLSRVAGQAIDANELLLRKTKTVTLMRGRE